MTHFLDEFKTILTSSNFLKRMINLENIWNWTSDLGLCVYEGNKHSYTGTIKKSRHFLGSNCFLMLYKLLSCNQFQHKYTNQLQLRFGTLDKFIKTKCCSFNKSLGTPLWLLVFITENSFHIKKTTW